MNDPILGTLGLCHKAGRLAIGDKPVTGSIEMYKAKLICIASDASERTKTRFARMSEEEAVPFTMLTQNKEELGYILGRSSCAVCAIEDAGFARSLIKKQKLTSAEVD